MPFKAMTRLLRYCLGGSLFALLVSSILPIWTAWYITDWETFSVPHSTLLAVLATLPENIQEADNFRPLTLADMHYANTVRGGSIFGIGAMAGGIAFSFVQHPPRRTGSARTSGPAVRS